MRKKNAFWTVEQPANSLMPRYAPFEDSFVHMQVLLCFRGFIGYRLPQETLRRHGARFVYIDMGAFGACAKKFFFQTIMLFLGGSALL